MPPPERPTSSDPILVFGPWSVRYDLGGSHPLTPRRFGPGIELVRAVAGAPFLLEPEPAADATLLLVHDRAYLDTVKRFSLMPFGPAAAGIGPGDTPAFAGMHEAAAAVAGGSVSAMDAIVSGSVRHAFHPGGGLHHAMRNRASGFCVYDDPALAIARARGAGLRVLYVDLDVHHGDGVQALHWDDPGVMTLSIHQSGRTLFPGTGFVDELGEGPAAGTAVNVPLDPGTGESGWLGALRQVLPDLAASFGPDVIVSQHGSDAHAWDPLANLRVTTTAMGAAARLVDQIAHRWAGGRWLATGGGGYDAYRVVPRAWSLVWLAARHEAWDLPTPAAWRTRWAAEAERYGQGPMPTRLEDEPNAGARPDPTLERADRRALEVADLVRALAVPALLRTAGELGWWDAASDLETGRRTVAQETRPEPAALKGRPEIVDRVDPGTWERLGVAARTLPPADQDAAHGLVLAGLRARGGAPLVTAAVADGRVVGAAISAGVGGQQTLVHLGVAPGHRLGGLAAELLRRHVAAGGQGVRWDAIVTVADRDPVEPLSRTVRAGIARRLLEGEGFRVERAAGAVGSADPEAIVARRG